MESVLCVNRLHLLRQVPEEIFTLVAKLRTLDMSWNRIDVLPDNIGLFTNLRTLSLNNNKLGKVKYHIPGSLPIAYVY